MTDDRSSRLVVFYKNGVLKNLAKLTEKPLFQSLIFDKVAGCTIVTRIASSNILNCNAVKIENPA